MGSARWHGSTVPPLSVSPEESREAFDAGLAGDQLQAALAHVRRGVGERDVRVRPNVVARGSGVAIGLEHAPEEGR